MLDETLIKKSLKTSFFGQYLYVLPETESTNSYALELVHEGAPEGTVILTDFQKNGKGRLGRTWQSSRGVNILMTIILRPRINVESVQCITLATADIIIRSMEIFLNREKVTDIEFNVKWPNDILVKDKKIAGILSESGIREKSVEYLVVGIGINVNQDVAQLSSEIRAKTTSLFAETGRTYQREKLIAQILFDYETSYIQLQRTDYAQIIDRWKMRCNQIGNRIIVETVVSSERGRFIDVDPKGTLLYETEEGQIKKLVAGSIKSENTLHGSDG